MFTGNIRMGKIMGIPIRLDYSWFLIFFILTIQLAAQGYTEYGYKLGSPLMRYSLSALTAILLFVSVLLHELGHSYVALKKAIPIRSITLFIFGGVAEITQEPKTATDEFEIAAAGPLVSVAIAAVTWSIVTLNDFFHLPIKPLFVLTWIAWVNAQLVIFNMVPGFPLDGGRIFRAILWKATGNLNKSTRVATAIGQIVGYLIIFSGIGMIFYYGSMNGIILILIGFFLVNAAKSSYQQVLVRSALSGIQVKEIMTHPVTTVNSWLTVDELVNDYFFRYRYSSFPVMDDGTLKGFVTLHDAKSIPRLEWLKRRVNDILHPLDDKFLISESTDAIDALNKMVKQDSHKLIVTRENEVVGIVTLRDVMALFKMKTDLGQ